jgi:hypothetical protein
MYLVLFGVVLSLAFGLIALGLFRTEHTELSLIGFVFLFLMGLTILNNGIEYKIGTNTTSNFDYSTVGNYTLLTSSFESQSDIYGTIDLGGNLSHTIGYWLLIGSFVGFLGVIMGLKHSWGFK